ncbi:AI-2E family transporter [Deinococcus radiotolerans]|uniref:AI-2E family transporter n=1 Tax=Deinococcus radiotolerans TaxID=1309407 RepID=A0ABQ2FHJ8_9DEIO|nr:AI-2E family transporter [Deinococcus radiotolerans]GGK89384.1 AI-2E family transporter [Deinococcus radiotolerans]
MSLTESSQPPERPAPWRFTGSIQDFLRTLWQYAAFRLVIFVLVGITALRVGGWLLSHLASVVVTVLGAYALAFLVNPILSWLERHRVGRAVGVLLLIVLLAAVLTFLWFAVSSQIRGLVDGLPYLAHNLKVIINSLLDRLDSIPGTTGLKASVTAYIDKQTGNLTDGAGPLLERLVNSGPDVLDTLSSLVGWLGQLGLLLTLAMYFMFEYNTFGAGLLKLFPRTWQPTVLQLAEDVSDSFGMYLRGTVITALACAALATTGLLILKVPNALALGILSAFVNLIPYVGIVVASIPPMLLAIPQGTTTVLEVAALYFIINQLLGNVIGPMVMGRSTSIGPASILIAILAGLALGGAMGAILAIPCAVLLKRWTNRYWLRSPLYRGVSGGAAPAADR